MESHTNSVPSFFICLRISCVSRSLGSSSLTKRFPFLSYKCAPSPRTDSEISKKEAQIRALESELMKYRQEEIPYLQVSREVSSLYPQIRKLTISRGAEVSLDSLNVGNRMLVVAESDRVLDQQSLERMTELLKLRLNDTTVLVLNTLSIADKEQNRERRK